LEEGMIVAGLTGGIASGKSTVARLFCDTGCHVIDLDGLSRMVVEPHKPAWREIVRWLGDDVLMGDGTLDRKRLGDLVFGNVRQRRRLERIIHPRVFEAYEENLINIREKDRQAIVITDVPLLMELDMQDRFDRVIVVYIPPREQIARLMQRDGLSRQGAVARLKSQMPIDEKAKAADYVIDNSGTLQETKRQVIAVYEALEALAQASDSQGSFPE
jgi:dephospho-CoA kinase